MCCWQMLVILNKLASKSFCLDNSGILAHLLKQLPCNLNDADLARFRRIAVHAQAKNSGTREDVGLSLLLSTS